MNDTTSHDPSPLRDAARAKVAQALEAPDAEQVVAALEAIAEDERGAYPPLYAHLSLALCRHGIHARQRHLVMRGAACLERAKLAVSGRDAEDEDAALVRQLCRDAWELAGPWVLESLCLSFAQGVRLEDQTAKLEAQNVKLEAQNAKLEAQNARLEERLARLEATFVTVLSPDTHTSPSLKAIPLEEPAAAAAAAAEAEAEAEAAAPEDDSATQANASLPAGLLLGAQRAPAPEPDVASSTVAPALSTASRAPKRLSPAMANAPQNPWDLLDDESVKTIDGAPELTREFVRMRIRFDMFERRLAHLKDQLRRVSDRYMDQNEALAHLYVHKRSLSQSNQPPDPMFLGAYCEALDSKLDVIVAALMRAARD